MLLRQLLDSLGYKFIELTVLFFLWGFWAFSVHDCGGRCSTINYVCVSILTKVVFSQLQISL